MKKILALLFMLFAAAAYAIPPMPSGTPPVGTITGLFTGEGDYLKSDGTKGTPSGSGDVVGPAASTQYKIPLWGAADKTLVDGVAVGTEGMLLRSAGAGAYPAWSPYTLALPGAVGAVLYSDGTNWTRSAAPSLLALTLYGQSAGGGAQLSLGSSSGSSDPNNGKMNFRNSTNGYLFTITSGVTGADIGWTLPTAAPGGANYLLNVDADGTMGYTDPSTLSGGSMTYPGAGVPNSTGSAWGTSYAVGTSANNLVQLDSSGKLPAVDGSQLTGISGGATTITVSAHTSTGNIANTETVIGTRITNTGATGSITLTLPQCTSTGYVAAIYLTAAYPVVLTPYSGDQIMVLTSAADKTLTSGTTVGTFIAVECLASGKWYPTGLNGAWTSN